MRVPSMSDRHAENRLVFDPQTRRIGVRVGKVELGQHIGPAYRIMVSEALGVAEAAVAVLPVVTSESPDDGLTVGSLSVQVTGVAVQGAAQAWAETLRTAAGLRLNVDAGAVELDPAALVFRSGEGVVDLFDLVPPDALAAIDQPDEDRVAEAIRGSAGFIQDMTLPGMLHGRAMRGRSVEAVRTVAGDTHTLIEDGGFAAIVLPDEAALADLWDRIDAPEPSGPDDCDGPVQDWITTRRAVTTGDDARQIADGVSITASRPFLLHGSIAPACALARMHDGRLTVWSHSQGIFPLRAQIARVLGLDPDKVELHYVASAGCYGHTAADDAAMDAALIASHLPGQAIRVVWPRSDEIWFGPVAAPMVTETCAALDASGRIASWHHEIWSGPHGQRPGGGGNVNLLGAIERDPGLRSGDIPDLPPAIGAGAARNAWPIYALPSVSVTTHIVQDLPVRTSSLRGLGAQMNTVAIEAMMDRLATEAGACPFAFRLSHLDDPRAVAVLETLRQRTEAAREAMAGRDDAAVGIALGRYKNKAAYAAVAATVILEDTPRVSDIWAVVDAGRVISEDGTRNQIEGGIVQAASWTLVEGALLRGGRIAASGWDDYPVLAWRDVPDLHIDLACQQDQPPLGVGECMVGPTSAAIAGGVSRVLGQPMANLPLDRAALISALA
jgi:nicotinate dehydrogenase subunit B